MREVSGYSLWVGNAYEARELRALLDLGIEAVVDLALNEPPLPVTRELIYCRLPILDGAGNPPWILRLAVSTVADMLRYEVKTLVFCSAGLSRTPVIVAGAISMLQEKPIAAILEQILRDAPADVSPALLHEVEVVIASTPHRIPLPGVSGRGSTSS